MDILNRRKVLWPVLCIFAVSSSAGQKIITAESGQDITLPCRAPDNNVPIIVIDWSRADLQGDVLLYRDEQFDTEHQHPSFKNRVDLQDHQMKDGDVSLILKNVTAADEGTYECRVVQRRTNRRKRAHLKTDLISIISLRVVSPPGPTGGSTEDEEEDGVSRGRYGLAAALSVSALVAVVFVIYIKRKRQSPDSHQRPEKQQSSEVSLNYLQLNIESPAAPNSPVNPGKDG